MPLRRPATATPAEGAQALREWQLRLESALVAGGMGVWELVPSSDELRAFGPTFDRLGLDTQGTTVLRGERFRRFVHPADRTQLEAVIARALLDQSDFSLDYRIRLPDGATRWLSSRGRFVAGGDGAPDRFIGVNFDITDRKAVEQALQDADSRRNEFLAMLAHELRNPLAPIHNAVRLLERAGERPELLGLATQMIKRQSAHLARLVDDLLEVSRVTQGRIELRKENLLVATAVLSAAETVRPLVREQRQTLALDVPTDIDLVADPARVVQVLANLLNNACKYTPEGGEIHVSARTVDGGRHVQIEVRDNGTGLDPELLPRVFDLFAQGEATLDRARGGLGIGLSLVKSLVELHGGTVRAASGGLGQGATFTVCLPREDRRAERRAPSGATLAVDTPRPAPTTMLVADDNRDAAESLAMLLEADGHRVRLAFDGEQALAEARTFGPRVLLLDLGMPRRDGFALARALRADDTLRDAVLIAMSGYGQRSDRERSGEAGFDAHLLKPADLAEVYAAITRVQARGPAPGPRRSPAGRSDNAAPAEPPPALDMADPHALTLISSMATKPLLAELLSLYEQRQGRTVALTSIGGVDAAKRVAAGEPFDVVVLGSDALAKLADAGTVRPDSVTALVRSPTAIAVPAGTAVPDVTSEAALRAAVLAAPSLGYSTGPSGVALAKLFERWGVSEQVKDRIVTPPPGTPVGSLVADGKVMLGFQQLSELLPLPGIQIVGPMPAEVGIVTTFSGGVTAASARADDARALLAFLASADADDAKRRQGMEPA
jgi:signal transduction histidine kinase/CheY-like chemotaxis protein/ABC-type molybdate transport system substrate-binding protein